MKILFTNVPWYGKTWHGIRAGCRWPFIIEAPKFPENQVGGYNTMPFFMAYAANYLRSAGNVGEVYFYDALARKHTYETFYSTAESLKPKITVIETSTPSINNDLAIAKNLRESGSEIALCGPHASVFAEDLIKLPYVDYILKGEYEVSSYEMCLMRRKGIYESRPLKNIENILPFRDDAVFNYADGFGQDQYILPPQLQIWSSRGCPYKCRFCLWNETMSGGYRARSPGSVSRELTECMKVFGFKSVLFDDDTFNVGDKRTIEMSTMMESIGIQWHAMVRADSCSWDAFWKMKRSGCVGLKMGVETFSQRGLDYLKKGYNAKRLIETVDFLLETGFKVFLSLMTDIPTETEEDKAETRKWLEYFVKKGASFQNPTCMPLPGTSLYKDLDKENKINKEDWFKFGCYHNEVIKK